MKMILGQCNRIPRSPLFVPRTTILTTFLSFGPLRLQDPLHLLFIPLGHPDFPRAIAGVYDESLINRFIPAGIPTNWHHFIPYMYK